MKIATWILVILAGATAGFAYWFFVGCNSGSCAITSSPVNSSIYGGIMAGLLLNTFTGRTKSGNEKKPE